MESTGDFNLVCLLKTGLGDPCISVKTKKGRSTKTALIVKNIKGTVKEKMKGGIGLNLSILEVDRDPY